MVGLKPIVDTVGVGLFELADMIGVVKSYTSAMANLKKSCSMPLACSIAECLGCRIEDLFSEPTAKRLAEIKVAYLQRQLELAASYLLKLEAVERFRSSPPVGSFDALTRDRDGRPVLLDYKTKEGA